MRMWLIDPEMMCNQHLLGEHVELHMLAGSLRKGKKLGKLLEGFVDPKQIRSRHEEIVNEMRHRGIRHTSPIGPLPKKLPRGIIDINRNMDDLARRCPACRSLMKFGI